MRLFVCCLLTVTLPCFGQKSTPAPASAPPPASTAVASPSTNWGAVLQGRPGYGALADSPPRRLSGPVDPGNFSAWGGKVVLDSGGSPPAGTAIDMRCGATIKRVAYTRADGKFVYREVTPDADARSYSTANNSYANIPFNTTAPGTARTNTEDCQVRAVLKGYTSTVAFPYRERRSREASDDVTIFLHNEGSVGAGSPVSQANPQEGTGETGSPVSQATPPDARKEFDKGMAALSQGNAEEALQNLLKAVEICPTCAEAWYELGRLEAKQGRVPQAKEDFSRALDANPKYVQPHLGLAALASTEKDWPTLARYSAAVIELDPVGYPGVYIYQALAEYNLNHLDTAEKSLREELKCDLDHRYPEANYMLGNLLAERGDYEGAVGPLRTYIEQAPTGDYAIRARQQLGQLEKYAPDRR